MLNAIHSHIRSEASSQSEKLEKGSKTAFLRFPAPADGMCAYHCVLGSATFDSWSKVPRNQCGVAVNSRISNAEAQHASSLREYALQSTPESNVIIAEQALSAQQSLSLDIGELSWLGESLGICIRCSIEEKVWCS